VKWAGYDIHESTWEPPTNLPILLIDIFSQRLEEIAELSKTVTNEFSVVRLVC
jgi:hypothetical protein